MKTAQEYINEGNGLACLCGSTKFFFEAMEANRRLTFAGWMVLQCGSWGHSFNKYSEPANTDYSLVKKLHFLKILESDIIVVVYDSSLYTGSSTKAEVEFAARFNKPVFYFDGHEFYGNTTQNPRDRFISSREALDKYKGSLGF